MRKPRHTYPLERLDVDAVHAALGRAADERVASPRPLSAIVHAMGFFAPTPSPYDPIAWSKLPLARRSRMVCEAWAIDGYGTPIAAFLAYAFKVALFIGGWFLACSFSPALVGANTHGFMATIASAPRW